MFGLENQKKKKIDPFFFDIEVKLRNPKDYRELKQKVENRIQEIKKALKVGGDKPEFDKYGVLLHGYTALLKVMARCLSK